MGEEQTGCKRRIEDGVPPSKCITARPAGRLIRMLRKLHRRNGPARLRI